MFDNLPKDPVMCLSVINTKLRDKYNHLDALCEDMGIDKLALIATLKVIDYEYNETKNQFV